MHEAVYHLQNVALLPWYTCTEKGLGSTYSFRLAPVRVAEERSPERAGGGWPPPRQRRGSDFVFCEEDSSLRESRQFFAIVFAAPSENGGGMSRTRFESSRSFAFQGKDMNVLKD
jgi:hypothetical protein